MGYEILLIPPLIILFGKFIRANCITPKGKMIVRISVITVLVFFFTVYPSPVGIKRSVPYLYWRGCRDGNIFHYMGILIKRLMFRIGIEFV